MTKSDHEITIKLCARSGESVDARLITKHWSLAERRKRALKVLGIGMLLTLASVFLPIAHFVLVPLGLILTPILTYKTLKLERVIPKQKLICPKCAQNFEFPFRFDLDTKVDLQCDACREVLSISNII